MRYNAEVGLRRGLLSLVLCAGALAFDGGAGVGGEPAAQSATLDGAAPGRGVPGRAPAPRRSFFVRRASTRRGRMTSSPSAATRRRSLSTRCSATPISASARFAFGRGDPREAERVYEVALSHMPSLRRALVGRAEARWALGDRAAAEADLEAYARATEDDPAAPRARRLVCRSHARPPSSRSGAGSIPWRQIATTPPSSTRRGRWCARSRSSSARPIRRRSRSARRPGAPWDRPRRGARGIARAGDLAGRPSRRRLLRRSARLRSPRSGAGGG